MDRESAETERVILCVGMAPEREVGGPAFPFAFHPDPG
jgi:hypothetical protein